MHMCAEISWSSFLIGQEQLTCYSNAAKVERGSPITGGKRRERSDKRETYRKKKRGRNSRKGRALKCPYTKGKSCQKSHNEDKALALLYLNVTYHILGIFLLSDISDF